jgi:hypothetical protein
MRNVLGQSCRGNQDIRFVLHNFFKKSFVYRVKWKKVVEQCRPQMQYGVCALHAGQLSPHTHTICSTAFTLQQWLQKRALLLRYTYIVSLLSSCTRQICSPFLHEYVSRPVRNKIQARRERPATSPTNLLSGHVSHDRPGDRGNTTLHF